MCIPKPKVPQYQPPPENATDIEKELAKIKIGTPTQKFKIKRSSTSAKKNKVWIKINDR